MSPLYKTPVILMADDDADDRLLAKDALEECGLSPDLRFVENGEELLDYLLRRGGYTEAGRAPRPNLILLDLNMPRKDGREALQEIKLSADLKRIPVVMFTTSSADIDIDRIYDLGANSFVTKPVTFAEMIKVMKGLGDYWFQVVELPVRSAA